MSPLEIHTTTPHRLGLVMAAVTLFTLAACQDRPSEQDTPPGTTAQEAGPRSPDAHAAVAAARSVLDAINAADPDLLRSVMMPDARIVATGRGQPRISTVEQMAAGISDPAQGFVERMWDPRLEVDGPIASVWARYDFYRQGELSHCGVDAFHLIQADGAWRVQSLVYNVLQPPACTLHPEGPPGG